MSSGGLSTLEARRRLAAQGPNELPRRNPPSPLRKLGAQFFHFFALMLWAASALAVVAGMPQLGIAIAVVVLINGAFAYAEEQRAERAAEQLEMLLPRRATVLRNGRAEELDSRELVVGDCVLLAPGDRVCADLFIGHADNLTIDSSPLTGESAPLRAEDGASAFAGTFVVAGEGLGTVVATGARTRLAHIAELTREKRRPPTPLMKELNRLVRTIAGLAIALGVVSFSIGRLVGLPATDGFLFAIGVTVALVPEGLLPTVTLCLAAGARAMARRGALVRRLDAVATLGSTTFICTDKTGTLTENRMSVVDAWTPAGTASIRGEGYGPQAEIKAETTGRPALQALALAAARCSTGRIEMRDGEWAAVGDPMEAAIHAFSMRLGVDVDADAAGRPVARRYPFDATRRRMSIAIDGELIVKGAPDSVLPRCSPSAGAESTTEQWARRGLRVLAVARRRVSKAILDAGCDAAERDLELLGLIGLQDPPRRSAREALAACRHAGLRVAIVTGDHPGTASAIAREVGLGDGPLFEGKDLPADEAVLGAMLDRDGVVIARVSPEDKHRIARSLQQRGHVVAMTGDGVNDGPALQQADTGIAMGRSGTDVAREAADLVLLDDDFSTIVLAIEHGRATFANVRRFLTYHLSDNIAELAPFVVWALSGGRFPLALSVLQILSLDLVTDQLPALALGVELPMPGTLRRPRAARHLVDRHLLVRALLVLGLAEACAELGAFLFSLFHAGWHPGTPIALGPELLSASGAAFAAVVIGQAANAFACRSDTRPAWSLARRSNLFLWIAIGVELSLLVASMTFVPLAHLLGQAAPSTSALLVSCAAAPLVLLVDAVHKWTRAHARGVNRLDGAERAPQA